MEYLTGVPTEYGIDILKQELYEKIKSFGLIDEEDNRYFVNGIHSIYFDGSGVLSVIAIVPKEEHFTFWNKSIELLDEDEEVIVSIATPSIQFVKGVGGEIEIKLPVSGEAGEIVFKADEYITINEAQELFLKPVIANTNLVIAMQNKLIEKGVIDG